MYQIICVEHIALFIGHITPLNSDLCICNNNPYFMCAPQSGASSGLRFNHLREFLTGAQK